MHTTYKIFLASSNELAGDRKLFGDLVTELNGRYNVAEREVNFNLYKWEHDLVSFTERRKQGEYNKEIENCHLFVLLYASKVGMYTEEEYDFAYARFCREKDFPRVIVFKKTVTDTDSSVKRFEDKLNSYQQFATDYNEAAGLRNLFAEALQKLFDKGMLHYSDAAKKRMQKVQGLPAKTLYNEGQSVPANFMGREGELKAIREKLEQGHSLMLINAEGGIGKTTLAARYWQDNEHHYRYRAWFFCENGIIGELKKLAPELGIDLNNMDEAQQVHTLKAALHDVSHDFLLVLDNANREADIEQFKQYFRGLGWHVLITSRCQGVLDAHHEYHIKHLPPPMARDLFKGNYKEDSPGFDQLLDRLLAAIDYNTLLIEVFSKNLKEAAEMGETLQTFLEKLETSHLVLSRDDSFEITTDWAENNQKKGRADAQQILEAMYDFTKLAQNEDERYLLVNLSLLPAIPYDLDFLSTLFPHWDKRQLRDLLKSLSKKGWLAFEDKSYRLSQVIQQLALHKNKETLQQDAAALVDNLNEKLDNDGIYLKYFNQAGPYGALATNIGRHLQDQPFYALSLLNFNACVFYTSAGDLESAWSFAQNNKYINEQLTDKNGLAISYSRLGGISEKLGKLEQALQFYQDETVLFEELRRNYPGDASFKNGLAISYEQLGGISEKLGKLEQALQFYRDDAKLTEELHRDYPGDVSFKNGLAISYEKLGGVSEKLGQLEQALQFYQQRNMLSEELHRDYPGDVSFKNGLAISYSKLGGISEKLGKLEQALQFYQDETVLFEELRRNYPGDVSFKNGLAISHEQLGGISEKLGQLEQALQFYRQRNMLGEELHRDYPGDVSFKSGLAISYEKLGGVSEKLGQLEQALQFYQQRNMLSEELHRDYPGDVSFKNGLAISYEKLGGVSETLGKLEQALQFFQQRNMLSEELHRDYPGDVSFKNGLAISYEKLGGISEKLGKPEQALQFYQDETVLFEELRRDYPGDVSFKNGLAISYSKLGGISEKLGKPEQALQFYEDYSKLKAELYRDYPGDVSFKNGLAISRIKIALLVNKQGDTEQALTLYRQAEQTWAGLNADFPLYAEFKNSLDWVRRQIEALEKK